MNAEKNTEENNTEEKNGAEDVHTIDTPLPYYAEDFLVYLETILGKSRNTVREYRYDLLLFFHFLCQKKKIASPAEFGLAELRSVRLTDLYAFINYLTKERGDKPATRARKVSAIRSFFKYAHTKASLIEEDPAAQLDSPKLTKKLPRYLELEDSRNLLRSIEGDHKERDFCMITLFLNCGMRLSELVGINYTDIKGNRLTVLGKGDKERTIYLNDACLAALARYLAVRPKLAENDPDRYALFLSERKKRISPKTVQYTVKKFLKKAGLDAEKLSTHKLRHTAATLMYTYGEVDIRSLQEILGHSSVATTEIYTHINNAMLEKAVSRNPLAEFEIPEDAEETGKKGPASSDGED